MVMVGVFTGHPASSQRLITIVAAVITAVILVCVVGLTAHPSAASAATVPGTASLAPVSSLAPISDTADPRDAPCSPAEQLACVLLDHATKTSAVYAVPDADLASAPSASPAPASAGTLNAVAVVGPSQEHLSILRL